MTRLRPSGYTLSEAYLLLRQSARGRSGAPASSAPAGEVRNQPARATPPAEVR